MIGHRKDTDVAASSAHEYVRQCGGFEPPRYMLHSQPLIPGELTMAKRFSQ